jgi:hypothetical protein
VGLADIASEDERGAGLLRGRVAVTRYVEQYACAGADADAECGCRDGG